MTFPDFVTRKVTLATDSHTCQPGLILPAWIGPGAGQVQIQKLHLVLDDLLTGLQGEASGMECLAQEL